MIVQEPVKSAILHCLDHYEYSNAVFLSERLHAEVKTDDSLFILATTYYRSGLLDHAYCTLKEQLLSSPQCLYLLAICAFKLQKYSEAEATLLGVDNKSGCNLDNVVKVFGDQASFALLLLARVSLKIDRRNQAIEALKRSLKLNPFLWSSFEELCNLGEKPNPNNVFRLSSVEQISSYNDNPGYVETNSNWQITPNQPNLTYITPHQSSNYYNSLSGSNLKSTPDDTPITNSLSMSGLGLLPSTKTKSSRHRFAMETPLSSQPSFGTLSIDSSDDFIVTSLVTPSTLTELNDQYKSLSKKVRTQMGHLIGRKESQYANKPLFSRSGNNCLTLPLSPSTPTSIGGMQSNVRRSSRLFSNSCSVKENNKSPIRNKSPKSPSRKTKQRISKYNINKTSMYVENTKNCEKERNETATSVDVKCNSPVPANTLSQAANMQKQSAEGLMSLLRDIGQAYLNLTQFNCKTAIEELSNLPQHQYTTSWIYAMIGLAYFELADYDSCIEYFGEIHNKEPHRFKYMDIYSTALWHLQKEVTLSALAQDLIQRNKNSAVTWCVSGNCFSLHKEHDTAIKFFQRAVQVDSNFTYAYTLLGHEYIMTDELDKAMSCFRSAIRINPRHYNAWFGIGTIYSKQERYHLAEMNYCRALSINPYSSVLMCHIGVVQHALKKTDKALSTLNIAINNDSKNPLCKFHRGSIYFAVGRHAEALKELEELKEIVPKESLVYYLIGKVHKKLGNTDLALMHFSWATDLDPKGASNQIREAFDPSIGRAVDANSPSSPSTEAFESVNDCVQPPNRFIDTPDEDSDDSL